MGSVCVHGAEGSWICDARNLLVFKNDLLCLQSILPFHSTEKKKKVEKAALSGCTEKIWVPSFFLKKVYLFLSEG